jgi:hypothetical protein
MDKKCIVKRRVAIVSAEMITTVLNALLSAAFLIISLRAFFLYLSARSARLFILGLAMGMIALTAAADTFSSNNSSPLQLNTDWFLFIGQAVSFFFFFLSLVVNTSNHLRGLMRWHIVLSLFLLLLLVFSPLLPDMPSPLLRTTLSGSRCLICFVIFFYYVRVFTSKETRFAFLMNASFLLLSFGYFVLILASTLSANHALVDHVGDVMRICGGLLLFTAFMAG